MDHYLKNELYSLIRNDEIIFDFIQKGTLDGLWYWDLEKPENEWMNKRFWEVLGYDPEEMPHLTSAWQNIINPEDLKIAFERVNEHLANPDIPYEQEIRYTHKNGSTIWIHCRGIAIRDKNGKPTRMLGAHHDITAIKRKEEESNLLSEMLDVAPNSITVHDETGKFLYANQKSFEIHGYSHQEFMSLNLHELDVPESAELIEKRIKAIHENGQAKFEVEHYKKDGSKIPLEVYVKLVDWKGTRAMLSIATDISEQKKMLDNLIVAKKVSEKNEQFYKVTFEKAAVGIAHVYPDGKLFKVNNKFCEITGYSADELIKMNFIDITHPDDVEKEAVFIQKVLANEIDSFTFEKRYFHKKGHIIWVILYSNVVRDKNGNIEFAICTISDITIRKNLFFDLVRSKEQLEQSEAKLKLALQVAKIGYWRYEIATNRVEWSEGHELLFGINMGDFKETLDAVQTCVHPDDRAHGERNLIDAINYKKPFVNNYRVIHPNGEVRWLHSYGLLYPTPSNNPEYIFGITQDITEQKVFEQELIIARENAQESEQKVRSMFENSLAGFLYISTQGDVIEANPAVLKIFGSPSLDETKKINVLNFPPLVEVGFSENVIKCINLKEIISDEKVYITKWGNTTFLKYFLVPVITNSKVSGVWCNIQDLTELWETQNNLEKAKQKAEESERFVKSIATQTPEIIYVFDVKSQKNIYINRNLREFLGYPVGEAPEDSSELIEQLIHPSDRDNFHYIELIEIWESEYIHEYEYRLKDVNQNWRWFSGKEKEFQRKDDKILSIIGSVTDITAQKNAENELIRAKEKAEESDRLKTAFLQNLSHEIRTPLNTIVGFSERINSPKITEEKRAFFTDIITKSSFQLLSIVSDILTMSTIDAGQEIINNEKVCVNSILSELENVFKQQLEGKSIAFIRRVDLTESKLEAIVDKVKLSQILSNLLSNSIKFTDSGKIEYGFKLIGENLEFFVSDTGIGIDSSKFDAIFNRFVQANESIQVNYGGTGLGLSICKGLVELMQGIIWVESEIGKGATFYFTIPYIKPISKTTVNQVVNKKKQPLGRFTVLIAEDQEPNYIFLQEFLSDFDCNVLLAKNGALAVEICKSNENVSVILMDIKMPVMDGFTATKIIKEFRPNLPIIAQTAYATKEDIKKFGELFDDFITKPFYSEKLAEKLRQYLYYE